MEDVKRVHWGKRDLTANKHWQSLSLKEYNPNKPIVVCIGGNGTINDLSANGVCKIVETYLQLLFMKGKVNYVYDNIDIISAVYPANDNEDNGKFSNQDIEDFVDNLLIKILQDENDVLVPLNEACRRLSQITFFTFCRGHLEVDRIMHAFYKELKVLGYTRQERDIMMLSMFEISYAPLTYRSLIPIMFVDSKQDQVLNSAWKNNETSMRNDNSLNGIAIKYERYEEPLLSGVALSEAIFDAIHVYSSRLRNNIDSDEHLLSILARTIRWDSNYEPNADCVSQMMAWIMCRIVENSMENYYSHKYIPRLTFEQLIQELEMILKDFTPEQLMSKEKGS